MLGLGVWALLLVAGFSWQWQYQAAAGAVAPAPIMWPADTRIEFAPSGQTFLMLLHPHCPCSRASVEELAQIMARCQGRLTAIVLLVHPDGTPLGWEQSDLWNAASAIPGVRVMADPQGVETSRFGALTSGQTLLYSSDGKLLFAGGITESRGHIGDNAGASFVTSLVLGEVKTAAGAPAPRTSVYGCPLFSPSDLPSKNGCNACRK